MGSPQVTLSIIFFWTTGYVFASDYIKTRDPIRAAEEQKLVYYPGDFLLGGLMPFHTKYNETTGECSKISELDGVIPLEAVLYVLDEINRSNILSFKLGFIAFDTCDSHSFTLEQALHFVHSHAQSEFTSGKECQAEQGLYFGTSADVFDVHKVVGLVTGLASSVTISLAQLTRLFHLPQISFLSTSPLLSDKRRYDYFFRTVPSDVNQVRAIVEILKFYKWNYISIVYADDEYGNRALHELEQLALTASLCFAAKLKLPVDAHSIFATPYDQMVEKLVFAKTQVVIVFSDIKFLNPFFDAMQKHRLGQSTEEPSKRESGNFILIGSDAWGRREETINEYPEITEGLITVQLNTRELSRFAHHYINLVPSETVCGRNPFYCKLWQSCHAKPSLRRSSRDRTATSSSDDDHKPLTRSAHGPCMLKDADSVSFLNVDNLRDAVFAYVYALKNMHAAKCGATPGLCEAMRTIKGKELKLFLSNVSFTEPDGSTFRFHDGSDGQPRYTIMNMHRNTNRLDDSVQYRWVEVGKYSQDADLKSTLLLNRSATRYREDQPAYPEQVPCKPVCDPSANEVQSGRAETSCCWKCIKCEPWQYPYDQQCLDCPPGFTANFENFVFDDVTQDAVSTAMNVCVHLPPTFLDYHSIYAIPVLAFSAVGIMATLMSAWVMLVHRNTPIVKAAGREHLSLLFFGLTTSYGMNFVIMWEPSSWSCFVVRFIGATYAICNSTVLIKIARIYRIFNSTESRRAQKLKYISPKSQVALTAGFVFVELIIITVWMAFDWPVVLQLYPNHMETELVCSDLHNFKLLSGLCYPLMLLFPMAYFAFLTRSCPAAFAEARHTGYGIYLTFINVLTFILIYIGNNSVRIRVLTVCVGLCLNATVILVSTFFTKAYIILFRPHKNSKDCIMNSSRSIGGRYATAGSAQTAEVNGVHCIACKALLAGNAAHRVSIPRPRSNPELGQATPTTELTDDEPENSATDALHPPHLLIRSKTCVYRNGHPVPLSANQQAL